MNKPFIKQIGFDESFKILAKYFFGEFSKVITDYEIINLPKKTDVLVIKTVKSISSHVRIFNYFKDFNIIEFKSVNNPFRIGIDIPKLLVYIGGILLNEKKASLENTTFTLLTARKPVKLFKIYKKSIQIVKKGVYLLKSLLKVPVYIMVVNEVKGNLSRELALIKEFSTGNERIRFIETILREVLNGKQSFTEYIHFAFTLYKKDIQNIIEKEGIHMTIIEKNLREWNNELGLVDQYRKEEKLSVTKEMLKKGFSIEDIMDITKLTREEIQKLQKE
jgi:hypothetical protein